MICLENIYSKGKYPANALSNFARHPFEIDGYKFECMEGFLQSLKFREDKDKKIFSTMTGREAKECGAIKKYKELYWKQKVYKRKSKEFFIFLSNVYEQMLLQNKGFAIALLYSYPNLIIHTKGKWFRGQTVLTCWEFCSILTKLRRQLRNGDLSLKQFALNDDRRVLDCLDFLSDLILRKGVVKIYDIVQFKNDIMNPVLTHDYKKVVSKMERAISSMERHCKKKRVDFENLVFAYLQKGIYEEALFACEDAFSSYTKAMVAAQHIRGNGSKIIADEYTSLVYLFIGGCLLSDSQKSKSCYERAVQLLENPNHKISNVGGAILLKAKECMKLYFEFV